MSSDPKPKSFPILEELLERSRRLREQSERLNAEMKELERLIALAARASDKVGGLVGKGGAGDGERG
jgi:prefoldin subunit 5